MEEERREGEGDMGVRRGGRRKVKSDEMREGVLENPLEEGEGIEAIAGGGEEDKMKREEEIHGRKSSERRGRLGEEGETHTHSQEPERPKSHGGVFRIPPDSVLPVPTRHTPKDFTSTDDTELYGRTTQIAHPFSRSSRREANQSRVGRALRFIRRRVKVHSPFRVTFGCIPTTAASLRRKGRHFALPSLSYSLSSSFSLALSSS